MYGGLRGGTRPPRENNIARGNEYYAVGGNIPRSKLTEEIPRNSGVALNSEEHLGAPIYWNL